MSSEDQQWLDAEYGIAAQAWATVLAWRVTTGMAERACGILCLLLPAQAAVPVDAEGALVEWFWATRSAPPIWLAAHLGFRVDGWALGAEAEQCSWEAKEALLGYLIKLSIVGAYGQEFVTEFASRLGLVNDSDEGGS
jgi:hypothetical protein